jgi:hypothetical protein
VRHGTLPICQPLTCRMFGDLEDIPFSENLFIIVEDDFIKQSVIITRRTRKSLNQQESDEVATMRSGRWKHDSARLAYFGSVTPTVRQGGK